MTQDRDLVLDPEEMRRQGYAVIDRLVEWSRELDAGPAAQRASRADLWARLGRKPAEGPSEVVESVDELLHDVIPFGQRTDHPRFMGYVPGAATWPAVLGNLIADGCNVFGGSWLGNAGTTVVELAVLDWLKGWLGFPDDAEGLLTSGGSEANLLGVLCARHAILGDDLTSGVAYMTEQTHGSVLRALRAAGLADDRIRRIPVDGGFRMRPDLLASTIADDVAAGLRPFLVVASAGTTNTGAVDPIADLAGICDERGLWLHVDGAYGGLFALTDRGRAVLGPIDRADSLAIDPHKGLAQPWGTGCVLVRPSGGLAETFHMTPTYLRDARLAADAVNLFDRGLQLTRPARAVSIWLSVRSLGVAPFRAALDAFQDQAILAQRLVEAHPNGDVLTPAQFGIVTFRRRDRLDEKAVLELNASGLGHVSSTVIRGEVTLRLCVNSFRTTDSDVETVVAALLGPLEG